MDENRVELPHIDQNGPETDENGEIRFLTGLRTVSGTFSGYLTSEERDALLDSFWELDPVTRTLEIEVPHPPAGWQLWLERWIGRWGYRAPCRSSRIAIPEAVMEGIDFHDDQSVTVTFRG